MKEIKIKNADEVFFEHKTSSGLSVYIWPYNLSEEVNMTLTVKFGSIHTKFSNNNKKYTLPNGIAHFLEHLKFNEKKDVTAHDFFNKIGSYTNAFTTYDHTSYEVICSENIDVNLNHLLEFVYNPYFTKGLINKEKPIVIEESNLSLDDPYTNGYNTLLNNIYYKNNKRFMITGNKDDIKSITLDDVLNAYNNFYLPENMFLVVTGNVNPYEIVKIVDKYFEKNNKFSKFTAKISLEKEPDMVKSCHEVIKTNVNSEKVLMVYKIPKKKFKSFSDINLRIISNLVFNTNFGVTSSFYDKLVYDNLIEDLFFSRIVEDDHIIVFFEVSSKYPDVVIKEIKDKFKDIFVSEEEFNRKLKCIIASSILGFEHPEDVNDSFRKDIINYDKVIGNFTDYLKNIKYEDITYFISNLNKYEVSDVVLLPQDK